MFMTPFTTDKLLKCERAIKVSQALSTADLRCRLSSCSAMLRGDKREPLVLGHKDLTDKTSAKENYLPKSCLNSLAFIQFVF